MLPVIDLNKFSNASLEERRAIAQDVGTACETMGFIYVSNHGVSAEIIAATRSAMEAFFGRPIDQKMAFERPRGRYRGYIPVSDFTETADGRPPVHYEAFLVGSDVRETDPAVAASKGLLIPNIWPDTPADFREVVSAYWQGVENIGTELLKAFALALGNQDENSLTRLFSQPLSNISLLHYTPRPDTGNNTQDDARAHFDTNALTVLLPGEVGGLEAIKPDGTWIEVPPLEGCFVVNIGNMMAIWSGGRFKSTMHRVHPPLGVDRYSIGYFAVPDYDIIIEPLNPGSIVDPSVCEPLHTGEDLARFVASCDAMAPVYG